MANPGLNQQKVDETVAAYHAAKGHRGEMAKILGIPENTVRSRIKTIKAVHGEGLFLLDVESEQVLEAATLRDEIRQLKLQLMSQQRETLDEEFVKKKIFKLVDQPVDVPKWLLKADKPSGTVGVPTLLASDWHWGEVVDPNQVNGVNQYNLAIAQRRAKNMIEVTIDLLRNHIAHKSYPGIVFALGGDMVSGDIHEELSVSNEAEIMPTVIDLWATLVWCIEKLADEFGNVFVPCVTGNHGRNTHKIRMKGRNYTSFDWLCYQFLAKRFEADKRVQFLISDGSDAHYQLYSHKYVLTHGDQFRGGDGMIGALGPIIRGDHKKRSRNSQIDMEYDTLLLGHWHQLIQLQRLIVNGSLKGYDEYAYQNNFPFEPPRQALWITHPEHGITFSAPVMVERQKAGSKKEWVSWK